MSSAKHRIVLEGRVNAADVDTVVHNAFEKTSTTAGKLPFENGAFHLSVEDQVDSLCAEPIQVTLDSSDSRSQDGNLPLSASPTVDVDLYDLERHSVQYMVSFGCPKNVPDDVFHILKSLVVPTVMRCRNTEVEHTTSVVGSLVRTALPVLMNLYSSGGVDDIMTLVKYHTSFWKGKLARDEEEVPLPKFSGYGKIPELFGGSFRRFLHRRVVHHDLGYIESLYQSKRGWPRVSEEKVRASQASHRDAMTIKAETPKDLIEVIKQVSRKLFGPVMKQAVVVGVNGKKIKSKKFLRVTSLPPPVKELPTGKACLEYPGTRGGTGNLIASPLPVLGEDGFYRPLSNSFVGVHGDPSRRIPHLLRVYDDVMERTYKLNVRAVLLMLDNQSKDRRFIGPTELISVNPAERIPDIKEELYLNPLYVEDAVLRSHKLISAYRKLDGTYGTYSQTFKPREVLRMSRVISLTEPNKVRTLTIDSGPLKQAVMPAQGQMLSRWKSSPQSTMKDDDLTAAVTRMWKTAQLQETEDDDWYIFSVDYSAATDKLHSDSTAASLSVCDTLENYEMCKLHMSMNTLVYPDWEARDFFSAKYDEAFAQLMEKQSKEQDSDDEFEAQVKKLKQRFPDNCVHIVQQTNGQCMGKMLSFPILCAVNLSVLKKTLHDGVKQSLITLKQAKAILATAKINGDDMIFCGPKTLRPVFYMNSRSVGLHPSLGKNYMSRVFCMINNQHFVLQKAGVVKVGYLNQQVLYGINPKKGYEPHRELDDTTTAILNGGLIISSGPNEVATSFQKMVDDYPIAWCSLTTTFRRFQHVSEKMPNGFRPNWFLPTHLGGFGLKTNLNFSITRAQRLIAARCVQKITETRRLPTIIQGVMVDSLKCAMNDIDNINHFSKKVLDGFVVPRPEYTAAAPTTNVDYTVVDSTLSNKILELAQVAFWQKVKLTQPQADIHDEKMLLKVDWTLLKKTKHNAKIHPMSLTGIQEWSRLNVSYGAQLNMPPKKMLSLDRRSFLGRKLAELDYLGIDHSERTMILSKSRIDGEISTARLKKSKSSPTIVESNPDDVIGHTRAFVTHPDVEDFFLVKNNPFPVILATRMKTYSPSTSNDVALVETLGVQAYRRDVNRADGLD